MTVLAPLLPSELTGFAAVISNWYRSTSNKVVRGSTLADIALPFTLKEIEVSPCTIGAPDDASWATADVATVDAAATAPEPLRNARLLTLLEVSFDMMNPWTEIVEAVGDDARVLPQNCQRVYGYRGLIPTFWRK